MKTWTFDLVAWVFIVWLLSAAVAQPRGYRPGLGQPGIGSGPLSQAAEMDR